MSEQLVEKMTAEVTEEQQEATPVEVPVEPVAEIKNPDAYEKALKEERAARKNLEKELKVLKEAEEKRAREQMSEQERAIEEAKSQVKAEYDAQILKARVEAKAASMNFHDPALALALVDASADASDDDLVSALEAIAADRPYLVKNGIPKMDMGPRTGKDGQSVGAVTNEDWFRNFMTAKQ